MQNCIFCNIAKDNEQATRFWENEKFFAILDLFPNTKGQALVIPKEHFDSNIFKMDNDYYLEFMSATKEVVKILEDKLDVKRVAMVIEGMGVNHAHVKLYPMHGLEEDFVEMLGSHQVYFEKYTGQITTLMGPKADEKNLEELASFIRDHS